MLINKNKRPENSPVGKTVINNFGEQVAFDSTSTGIKRMNTKNATNFVKLITLFTTNNVDRLAADLKLFWNNKQYLVV